MKMCKWVVPRYKEIFQENSQEMSEGETEAGFCLDYCFAAAHSYTISYVVSSTTEFWKWSDVATIKGNTPKKKKKSKISNVIPKKRELFFHVLSSLSNSFCSMIMIFFWNQYMHSVTPVVHLPVDNILAMRTWNNISEKPQLC